MGINPLGVVAGVTAFLSIWIGHISVRAVEARTNKLWQAMAVYLLLGFSLEAGTILIRNQLLSVICGIAGITLLWDVLELLKQARRVREGRALANPANPRHAALLAEPGSKARVSNLAANPSQ